MKSSLNIKTIKYLSPHCFVAIAFIPALILSCTLLALLAATIILYTLKFFDIHVPHHQVSVWLTTNLGEAILAPAVILTSIAFTKIEHETFASLGWELSQRWALELLLGFTSGSILILAAAGATLGLGALHFVFSGYGIRALMTGGIFWLLVAVFEEALFRGYPFQRLVRGLGFWPAQAVTACLFALAHFGNPGMNGVAQAWATLNLGMASVLLGLCWRCNKSMALPIGLHLGWNWTMGSVLGFGVSGLQVHGWLRPAFMERPEWMSGGAFGLEAGLPGCLALGLGILILVRENLLCCGPRLRLVLGLVNQRYSSPKD